MLGEHGHLCEGVDPPASRKARGQDRQQEFLFLKHEVRLRVTGGEQTAQQVRHQDDKEELAVVQRCVKVAASALIRPHKDIGEDGSDEEEVLRNLLVVKLVKFLARAEPGALFSHGWGAVVLWVSLVGVLRVWVGVGMVPVVAIVLVMLLGQPLLLLVVLVLLVV